MLATSLAVASAKTALRERDTLGPYYPYRIGWFDLGRALGRNGRSLQGGRMGPCMSVFELFAAVGMEPQGPVAWGEPVLESEPGVYVVASTADPHGAGREVKIDRLGDEERKRWLPGEPVVYVGQTRRSLSRRIGQFYRHKYGARSPHRGGQAVKLLASPLWVHWAASVGPRVKEHAMIAHFIARSGHLPFANRQR